MLPPNIIEALPKLGNGYEKPTDNDLNELELFVLNLYCKKLAPNVRSLASLRWLIFSKQQAESRKLPPTREAFRQKSISIALHCPSMEVVAPANTKCTRF